MPDRTPLNDFQDWFSSIPPITRYLLVCTLTFTIASAAGFISPYQLILIPSFVIGSRFEPWRLLTCFFWHKLGFDFLMTVYFMYRQSSDLETGVYAGRTADYAWFILCAMIMLDIIGWWTGSGLLSDPLLMCIIYMWSMCNMEKRMTFMFGISFKALYLPWVLIAFEVLMGGPISVGKLIGIFVGHILYFTDQVFPRAEGGFKLLPTPSFLIAAFPDATTSEMGDTTSAGYRVVPPARDGADNQPRHVWGAKGRRLGG